MIFMYNLQINIDRISALTKSKGLSINQMLKNAELSTTILDNMKRGRLPSVDKIQSIAEYFDCSVDYLLGRTDNPEVNK
jgi:transcriptional regulator with XRE-family HTH domain